MPKLIVTLLLLLAGCSTSQGNKIEATIKNDTPTPFVVKVFTPLGNETVLILPGAVWRGSVDRRMILSPVKLVVELPAAPK